MARLFLQVDGTQMRWLNSERRVQSKILVAAMCLILPIMTDGWQPSTLLSRRTPLTKAFQTPPGAGPDGRAKKGKRFAQTAHRRRKGNMKADDSLPSTNTIMKRTTTQQPRKDSSKEEYTPPSTDGVWKSRKSIDELEQRLASRWGTDLSSWTSHDFDDDDEDADSSIGTDEAPIFRARPVLDPWQESEGGSSKSAGRSKPSPSSSIWNADKLETDEGARRAKQNQARLRQKRGEKEVPEFYDEDDLGFEPRNSSNSAMNFNHLIAPKPAGGQGTTKKDDNVPSGKESSNGLFFNTKSAVQAQGRRKEQARNAETDGKGKQQRRELASSVPLLDEGGNPLLLTLEQAQRNFEESLIGSDGLPEESFPILSQEVRDWSVLGIESPVLLQNLEEMGCGKPLPVQEKTCLPAVQGKDVLVGTYTGSGKTLAFLAPLVQKLLIQGKSDLGPQILVIAPGRELASQIMSVARDLVQGTEITAMLAIGGTTFARNLEQIRKRKPDILVGTPGRLAELVVGKPGERNGRLKIGGLHALVLDEFDALLEYKPHREPTVAVVEALKRRRGDSLQSILCSATASDMMESPKLSQYLREDFAICMADDNDVLVTPAGSKATSGAVTRVSRTVIHGVLHVPHRRYALEALRRILHTEPLPQQILIFVENSRKVNVVVEKLEQMGIIAAPLHGGMGLEKVDRAEVSKALREGFVGIVVATELAARGLDAPLLTHVVNMDLPTDASHYAHRAGRCGRGGRPGVVINLTASPQERNVPQRFAEKLGVNLFTVEAKKGRLSVIDPRSQDVDSL